MTRTLYTWLMSAVTGLCTVILATPLQAQDAHEDKPSEAAIKKAAELHKEQAKKHADNKDMLLLPGLVADRKNQRVEIYVETTSAIHNSVVEFFVIGKNSSHGYEALTWSFAGAADIHRALEFIGMKAGLPIDYSKLRFVAKGERVVASLRPIEHPDERLRLETILTDSRTERPLPEDGFIFSGSIKVPSPDSESNMVFAAEAYDPFSIIPVFNNSFSVMDVPWTMNQNDVYENVHTDDHGLKSHELMVLVLEPEFTDGRSRVKELELRIGGDEGFALKDADDKTLNEEPTFEAVLNALHGLLEGGQSPYLSPRFDPEIKLGNIQKVCAVLEILQSGSGVKIEPPKEGRVYYKAFLPDPEGRTVEERITQPWELHLDLEKPEEAAALQIHEAYWKAGSSYPEITKHRFDVTNAGDIRREMDGYIEKMQKAGSRPPPRVILIYAHSEMKYESVLKWINPLLSTHSTIYIYLEEEDE